MPRRLSVCIVNWNTRAHLCRCLHALWTFPPDKWHMEILVADNHSPDGSARMVRERFPEVQLIANTANLGYARATNQLLQQVTGDAVLLLNPDVTVHQWTLTRALSFLDSHPDAAAVGIRLLGTDGKTQSTLRAFPGPLPLLYEATGLAKLCPHNPTLAAYRMTYFDYNRSGEADQPMASFLLMPRRALAEVGFMDEQFPLFFNDVDWCWRAKREHGWRIYYTPDALATHAGGASTRQRPGPMRSESHRALGVFYAKHYKQTLPAPIYCLIRAIITLSRVCRPSRP